VFCLELTVNPVSEPAVPVIAPKVCIPGCRFDVEVVRRPLLNKRHVEGATTEVDDRDRLCVLVVQAVCDRGRNRLA